MRSYCIDASVALKWVLPEELNFTARRLLQGMRLGEHTLIGPLSLPLHAMRGLAAWREAGCLTRAEANEIAAVLRHLLQVVELRPSREGGALDAPMIVSGGEHTLRYDRAYLDVARNAACELLTADRALAQALHPRYGNIRWLGDWRWQGE